MSVENRVFSRLFKEDKTELSIAKVELSVIDDIDSKTSKAVQASLQGSKLAQQAIAAYNSAADLYAEADSLASRAIPQAKELGAKQLIKDLQSKSKGIGSNLKRANKSASSIKSSI
tara:strand:- start:900 stop:1247 length:348 start_codon:yes stop_codon:yes gene_type:complete